MENTPLQPDSRSDQAQMGLYQPLSYAPAAMVAGHSQLAPQAWGSNGADGFELGRELPDWVDRFATGDLFICDVLATIATHLDERGENGFDHYRPDYLAQIPRPQQAWRQVREHTAQALNLADTKRVVVVMIDGFGASAVSQYSAYLPFLRNRKDTLVPAKTIAPSTTAAAITAFTTGALPGATRMVGWSIAQGDTTVDLLSFAGAELPAQVRQQVPTVFEKAAAGRLRTVAVNATRFQFSGLTQAALRGAVYRGADSLQERLEAAVASNRAGTDLVYLYWHGLDHAGHNYGVGTQPWLEALEEVDRALSELAQRCLPDTAIILTADHGMVTSDPTRRLDIADIPALREGVRILAGEGRAPHIHVLPGQTAAVLERWQDYLGERALVVPATQLPALFGQGRGCGDVGAGVAFMADTWTAGDSRTQKATTLALPGVHGSLTASERQIIAGRVA